MAQLGACYKQLNSSVGEFGTDTLIASTAALESNSPGDKTYLHIEHALSVLGAARDKLAIQIKGELDAAAFGNDTIHGTGGQIVACDALLGAAHALASQSWPAARCGGGPGIRPGDRRRIVFAAGNLGDILRNWPLRHREPAGQTCVVLVSLGH